jgi:hypothetical protein
MKSAGLAVIFLTVLVEIPSDAASAQRGLISGPSADPSSAASDTRVSQQSTNLGSQKSCFAIATIPPSLWWCRRGISRWVRMTRPYEKPEHPISISQSCRRTGQKYRLPNGAEWDYGARAGTRTPFWWGREVGTGHAQCDACGNPIKQYVVPRLAPAKRLWGLRHIRQRCGIGRGADKMSARPEMERDQNKDVSSRTIGKIALWEFAHPG